MAEIRWFGHNCFRIRAREATVLTDPVGRNTGYAIPRQKASIVTISHDHTGHNNIQAVRPDFKTVDGPGEYELSGVFITGIRTYHDASGGADLGYNTIYLIDLEGMTIGHLGDLGHPLTAPQIEEISRADILMVPAGNGPVISQEQAAEIVSLVQPRLVIPMQYNTPLGDADRDGIEGFIKALGTDVTEAVDKLTIKSSELQEATQLVTLEPQSETSRS